MKKTKLFAASVAAMALVGCTSEDYVGVVDNPTGDGIGFGSGVTATTRANSTGSQAAEKLNNNFIVYGFKTSDDTEADASKDQMVFDHYNVNYMAGTANTTESNTADWEYVGYANHSGSVPSQTIKYWDFSAKSYVFSAVSGTGITAEKIKTGSMYEKGWTVKIPAGGDISTLYASDRKPVAPSDYKKQVDLTFRSLITKIRFAMYEVIPGYEVHIDKFYYKNGSWQNTETNFAIDGTFKTANATATTPLTITYYDDASGIENRPKVSYADGDVTIAQYGIFGANIQATSAIGTTSASATYDQSDKSYTLILPYESSASSEENNLELYVDYTLTSTDGSGEKIEVKHASAKVPTNFAQWKPNFAYTYIFKISDNTNGTTGTPGDPNDPTVDPTDPTGLFPITFDAVVITDEEDVQETITSVSDPSITTYQMGVVVTANDEYVAGKDIYFENGDADVSNYAVYEVNNYGTEATTEEVVANWKNNFCVLTKVDVSYADGSTDGGNFIPLSNGTFIKKAANQAAKFTPAAGKTYVIANNVAASATQYKVVKVAGSATDPTYEQKMTTSAINAAGESAVFRLRSNSPKANSNVLGAASLLKIYDSSDNDVTTNFTIVPGSSAGNYKIGLTPAAIAAGANDTYTVKFNGNGDQTFTVDLSYTTLSPVTVVTGGSTASFTLRDGTNSISDPVIENLPAGVTITETSTKGTYEVVASADATPGSYDVTIAGQSLTINVDSYAFYNVPEFTFNYLGTDDAKTLNLRKNYTDADVEVTAMTGIETGVATITKATAGAYTVVPVAPGTYTVKYENTSAVITVNQYTLTPSAASIAKSTGSAVLTLTKNNGETKTVNASTNNVTVYKGSVSADDSNKVTTGFSLTTNGQTMKFGNVAEADTYIFHYTEDGKVVATATVTVQ